MKKIISLLLIACLMTVVMVIPAFGEEVFEVSEKVYYAFTAEHFKADLGTWKVQTGDVKESKFTEILLGIIKMEPANDATTKLIVPEGGTYYVWVSSRDFADRPGTRTGNVKIDSVMAAEPFGTHGVDGWGWQKYQFNLKKGEHKLALVDNGVYTRVDMIVVTSDPAFDPSKADKAKYAEDHKYDPAKVVLSSKADPQFAEPTPMPTPTPAPTATPKPTTAPTPAPTKAPVAVQFKDLTEAFAWAKPAIEELAQKGIVQGKSEGIFEPDTNISRAEFVKIIVGSIEKSPTAYKHIYKDVATSQWFAEYIQAANDASLIDEALTIDGIFKPDDPITREEMTSLVVKAYETVKNTVAPKGNALAFADASEIEGWAENYVGSAAALEIIKGKDGNKFDPKGLATRAEAAVMIQRLLSK